jgi:hypothetical protein
MLIVPRPGASGGDRWALRRARSSARKNGAAASSVTAMALGPGVGSREGGRRVVFREPDGLRPIARRRPHRPPPNSNACACNQTNASARASNRGSRSSIVAGPTIEGGVTIVRCKTRRRPPPREPYLGREPHEPHTKQAFVFGARGSWLVAFCALRFTFYVFSPCT